MFVYLARELAHLLRSLLLHLLASVHYLLDLLLLFFELDLLVEHLQLGQNDGLDVLERFQEAGFTFFEALRA